MARSRRTETGVLLLLSAALLRVGVAHAADPPRLDFERRGEPVTTLDLPALRERVEPGQVRVFEPYEDREVPFRALRLADVLDAVYGPGWRDEQELLLHCADGYEPSIPIRRVLEHRPWLAFARLDQESFRIRKHESGEWKTIELAPFYLVWENLDDPTIRQEGDYGWPYQLTRIDLIRTADRFGRMAPPDAAAAEARAGFDAFRVHCSKCHRIHGEGGSIGPELDPSSLSARDRGWLRAWIEDPSRIAPRARMPALNPALPDRARVVDAILAYLEALAAEPRD